MSKGFLIILVRLLLAQTLGAFHLALLSATTWTIHGTEPGGPRPYGRRESPLLVCRTVRALGWRGSSSLQRTIELAPRKGPHHGGEFQGCLGTGRTLVMSLDDIESKRDEDLGFEKS